MFTRKKIFILISSSLLAFAVTSCYYDAVLEPLTPDITDEVSFSEDIIPILNEKCNTSGCHNSGGVAPDLTAAQAYNSLTTGNYVDVNSPEDSELIQWLKGKRSTPMPLSGPDPNINALVLAWIKQGAQNN